MSKSHNLDQARFNMVEQQIRPAEVLDPQVLQAIENTPRENFVSDEYRELAFSDSHIPINNQEVMMTPIQEARMLQALDIHNTDTILEIGTGSGYFTALLAKLGNHVTSVDIDAALMTAAKKRLAELDIQNVKLETGDAGKGWSEDKFDAIAVTGSMPVLEEKLKNQLEIGGRLCVVVGREPTMEFMLVTRVSDTQWREECLFETVLPALKNVEQAPQFIF